MLEKLSQRDSRWQNILLGTSQVTIGNYGCVITCVSMLAGTTPDFTNEKLKQVSGYQNGNLLIWSKIKSALPNLEFEWRGYGYDNDRVKQAIEDYGACLVEVSGARIGGIKHWVLFIGDGKMIDPYFGTEKSTGWYGDPTGYAIIKKTGELTNSDALTACLAQHTDLINQLEAEKKSHAETVSKIESQKTQLKEEEKKHFDFVNKLAQKLNRVKPLPEITDETWVSTCVDDLIKNESDLIKELKIKKNELEEDNKKLKESISELRIAIEKQERENETLKNRLDDLETSVDRQVEKKNDFEWLSNLINKLFKR